MNIFLRISYDGSCFRGFQRQSPTLRLHTVQSELERELSRILCERITVIGSGRTDAGVHAIGQAVNFKIKNLKIPVDKIKLLLNRALEGKIVIRDIYEVSDDFHARYSAKGKLYLYWIKRTPIEPWLRNYCWFWDKQGWDMESIREAASIFRGVHDFSGYSIRLEKGLNTIKEIFNIEVSGDKNDLKIAFHGRGFLRCMVRVLTSAIISHGCGLVSIEALKKQLDYPGSINLPPKAPPNGLFLVNVNYNQEP